MQRCGEDSPHSLRHQPIHLPFHIGSLRPHAARAREELDLPVELCEEEVGAVVPRRDVRVELVCLVDGGDGEGVVPQAERLARGKGRGAGSAVSRELAR